MARHLRKAKLLEERAQPRRVRARKFHEFKPGDAQRIVAVLQGLRRGSARQKSIVGHRKSPLRKSGPSLSVHSCVSAAATCRADAETDYRLWHQSVKLSSTV